MLQKTCYKRRKQHTIEKALELDLYARMRKHLLYQQTIKALPITLEKGRLNWNRNRTVSKF